jgi:hypothetical protein
LYDEQYQYLKKRGNEAADKEALAVIDRMSSGDRLWYRVGAMMAARIEERLGHDALVSLVAKDHPTLVETYRQTCGDNGSNKSLRRRLSGVSIC